MCVKTYGSTVAEACGSGRGGRFGSEIDDRQALWMRVEIILAVRKYIGDAKNALRACTRLNIHDSCNGAGCKIERRWLPQL